MSNEELQEVKEYHFKKIKKLCQEYIDKELDYKTGVADGRLIEVGKLIRKLNDEIKRINEIIEIQYDNKGGE